MKLMSKREQKKGATEITEEAGAKRHFPKISYARELRAVGQALEARHLFSLDLELADGLYIVRGKITASKYAESSFSAFLKDQLAAIGSVLRGKRRPAIYEIDLRYKPQDVEELDSKGRVRRRNAERIPDPYSLSQKLRGVGSFLDYRPETTLAGISVEDRWVTVRYRTAEGRIEQAKQDVAYFYDYWVKMYLRRTGRDGVSLPDDPTVIVDWGITERQQSR
jgi:hypothetical protein